MKKILKSLALVVFVAIAGAIYTAFSHGVTSVFMSYAFVWLLVGFIIKFMIAPRISVKTKKWIKSLHHGLWLSYMINATLGSISVGIIQIAGSFTNLLYMQLIFGLVSLVGYILLSLLLLWSSH
jgi:hypothetical protein